ncbi:hypothetical protein BN137_2114 [Cronobacter condimenti 1330]|uniref:Uncharacterized protein n=1 Tax=Cronobacter condimenti 1330 TaxID=1073999 RepID=K8A1A0_9ENTR|nr:hypothetical protein BN137_2114 [Cronobacter condimenti 1330]
MKDNIFKLAFKFTIFEATGFKICTFKLTLIKKNNQISLVDKSSLSEVAFSKSAIFIQTTASPNRNIT